jgi:hypothetical protein
VLEVLSLLRVVFGIFVIDEAVGILRELVESLDKSVPLRSSLNNLNDYWLEH